MSEVITTAPPQPLHVLKKLLLKETPPAHQLPTALQSLINRNINIIFSIRKKPVEQHRQKYICTTFLSLPKIDTSSFLYLKKKQNKNPNRNTQARAHAHTNTRAETNKSIRSQKSTCLSACAHCHPRHRSSTLALPCSLCHQ